MTSRFEFDRSARGGGLAGHCALFDPVEDGTWAEIRPRTAAPLVLLESALTGGARALMLVYPVVRYPAWMTASHRSQGPVAKQVLWYSPLHGFLFGQVDDCTGWCVHGRWDDLRRAVRPDRALPLGALLSRSTWQVDEFMADPSFRHFALASGLRDPWAELQWAVRAILGRLRTWEPELAQIEGAATVGWVDYLRGGGQAEVRRNRLQALDLLPSHSLRLALLADPIPTQSFALQEAIDRGQALVPELAAWLGCSEAFTRHLIAQRANLLSLPGLKTVEEFRLRVVSLQGLPRNLWPDTAARWLELLNWQLRLSRLFQEAGEQAPALTLQVLAMSLREAPASETVRQRIEQRAALVELVRDLGVPRAWALAQVAALSPGRVRSLMLAAHRQAQAPTIPVGPWVRLPLPEGVQRLAAEMSASHEGHRLQGLASFGEMTAWGKRVGNCLAVPFHAGRYVARGRVVLALTCDGIPTATLAVTPQRVEWQTEMVVAESSVHDLPISSSGQWLVKNALRRARDHLRKTGQATWEREIEDWCVRCNGAWRAPVTGEAGARQVVEDWLTGLKRQERLTPAQHARHSGGVAGNASGSRGGLP